MTTGRLGQHAAPPNAAYAGQVVHFPDPVRAARHPRGVWIDPDGYPDFAPYARAVCEIAKPPEGFGVDELRLTDYVSANAAQHAAGHPLWADLPAVATPHGWTWHHRVGGRRLELIPVEVKSLLRHHGGLALCRVDHDKRGTRALTRPRPVHFRLPNEVVSVSEARLRDLEEELGCPLPDSYRGFLKAAGGCAPSCVALEPGLGLLLDQPFFTVRDQPATNDLGYVNKCLRDHLTKDHLAVGYVQGGLLAVKLKGERTGSVWFCPYDDARDRGEWESARERVDALLLPCGDDWDEFLLRLAGNPPELQTVADLMVEGGFATAVPTDATDD